MFNISVTSDCPLTPGLCYFNIYCFFSVPFMVTLVAASNNCAAGIKIRNFYKDTICLQGRISGGRCRKNLTDHVRKKIFRNKLISANSPPPPPPRRQKIFGHCTILGVTKIFSELLIANIFFIIPVFVICIIQNGYLFVSLFVSWITLIYFQFNIFSSTHFSIYKDTFAFYKDTKCVQGHAILMPAVLI